MIVGMLVSCAAPLPVPPQPSPRAPAPSKSPPAVTPSQGSSIPPTAPLGASKFEPPVKCESRSRWVPVAIEDLPGLSQESMAEVWTLLLANCDVSGTVLAPLCSDIRRLSIASDAEQRLLLLNRLQAYRLESLEGEAGGLLTAYYEPVFDAQRVAGNGFNTPLYAPPTGLASGRPWFSRQDIESLPAAQTALRGREIAWLADPVDALILHIQGSGRLRITEPDGSVRTVRLSFAASNEQPYQSVGRWLLDKGETRDASWPGIKAWLQRNPQRQQELLWTNPRYVFFKELPLGADPSLGPRGAQGLPLIAGRSVAIDPLSMPYGTPLWLVSPGPTLALSRLVLAQDTGSAIVGAVRADFFMGTGREAGEVAGRLKQSLRLWALWPKP
jgi:membrane-bound lytic murein transglycosylase A